MKAVLPAKGTITQGFSNDHQAIDIANSQGTAIVAARTGKVTFTGQLGSGTNDCGLAIQIGEPLGKEVNSDRYCHNYKILVKVGQTVKAGDKIALMGYTGYTMPDDKRESSHCHWVAWVDGKRVDGLKLVNNNEGAMKYEGGYTQYKEDLLRMDGKLPAWTYEKWKSTYSTWNRGQFCATRARFWRTKSVELAAKLKAIEDNPPPEPPATADKFIPVTVYVKQDDVGDHAH